MVKNPRVGGRERKGGCANRVQEYTDEEAEEEEEEKSRSTTVGRYVGVGGVLQINTIAR